MKKKQDIDTKYAFSLRGTALSAIREKAMKEFRERVDRDLKKGKVKYMSRKTLLSYLECVDPDNPYRRTKSTTFYESAIRELVYHVVELAGELKEAERHAARIMGRRAGQAEGQGKDGERAGGSRKRPVGFSRRAPDYEVFIGSRGPEEHSGSLADRINYRRGLVKGDERTRNGGERGWPARPGEIKVDRAKPDRGDDSEG